MIGMSTEWRSLVFVGLFLIAGFAVPLISILASEYPPSAVLRCEKRWSHGEHVYAQLSDGREQEVTWMRGCPPQATTLEKRRGEYHVRINGIYRPANRWDFWPGQAFIALGLVLIGLGVVARGKKPRPVRPPAVGEGPGDLPTELRGSTPRPLPRWARPRHWATALYSMAVLFAVYSLLLQREYGGAALVLLIATVAAGIVIAVRHAKRRLLATGTPTTATITDLILLKGYVEIRYEYDAPGGRRSGSTKAPMGAVVRRYGSWPEAGDAAYVIYDAKSSTTTTLWSVAVPPGGRVQAPLALLRLAPFLILGTMLAVALFSMLRGR